MQWVNKIRTGSGSDRVLTLNVKLSRKPGYKILRLLES